MIASELIDQFRSDVVDVEEPFLWSDPDVLSYIDSAQKQFCRKVGGIADATSSITSLSIGLATDWIATSPLILKIREAYLSDGTPMEVVNAEDLASRRIRFDGSVGTPKMLIIGMEVNNARIYPVSNVINTIQMMIDRLPLKSITDGTQKLEIQEHHKEGLGIWVRYRAYSKQDAETMDKNKALTLKAEFEEYCVLAKKERDRAKHKTRVVRYGGL